MPDKSKRGRPKKVDKVIVDTNIRITSEAHTLVKTLADLWGLSMSDALVLLIKDKAPEVVQAVEKREEIRGKMARHKPVNN